jgi:hypothetical protein
MKMAGKRSFCVVVDNCYIQISATSMWQIPSEYGKLHHRLVDVLMHRRVVFVKMLLVYSAICTIEKLVRLLCYFSGLYTEP